MADVCLVCMPYAAVERPSIATGLLKAIMAEGGLEVACLYPNLEWAAEIGVAGYSLFEQALGDLTFSGAAFPEHRPPLAGHLRRVYTRLRAEAARAGLDSADEFVDAALALRERAEALVDRAARAALETGAPLVGCTSMYWQHAGSLAVLRRVRALDPSVRTLLGGANCEGVMGVATHRAFPWVDYVVSGEADDLVVPLCRALLAGEEPGVDEIPAGVFGPAHRAAGYPRVEGGDGAPRAAARNVGSLPVPDYDDYFRALAASGLGDAVRPGLLVETARGCWYGAVQHCKFCGISDGGMVYHARAAESALEQFDRLEGRYGISRFEVTDNIMDMSYFQTVLPRLAERPPGRKIFWETKANLRRPQVELLARAGVRWIQPGVESLDSRTLALMNKGVKATQNVLLLRWCREEGVRVSWNWLWGFPGEDDAWYAEAAARIPLLHHLQPPRLVVRVRYDRYSVYQAQAEAYELRLKPLHFMPLVYPLPEGELMDLTYYFEAESERGAPPVPLAERPGVMELYRQVRRWQKRFWRRLAPVLAVDDDGRSLRFVDTRACAPEPAPRLTGAAREVYLACETAPPRERLAGWLEREQGSVFTAEELEPIVEDLLRRRLVMEADGKLVALALRGAIPALPRASEFPGGFVAAVPAAAHAG
ncbi:MAG TPA: RiPP maturation radical SAM C-methyltransferase [Longimicrobium sp.]|nr:RiPP maturation radical SAM C-methyltransferase [Longimicrobium sp.]